ncbi:MAG: hypothetical protein EU535_05720 [Promethearchaeota archaeon]|nr:MAG: hypothetical protein EU535_05720 [Candidatus Lokiarchaeota archaeon]
MRCEKESLEAIFTEFSQFLQNSEIITGEVNARFLEQYFQVSSLFEKKICRCEVGKSTLLPSQVNELCILFKILSEKIKHVLIQKGSYVKVKNKIINEILSQENLQVDDTALIERLIFEIYDGFNGNFENSQTYSAIPFNESIHIFNIILENYNYSSSKELSTSLHFIFYELYTELVEKGQLSKALFRDKAVQRLGQQNLLTDLFIWDILMNLSLKCIHFLTNWGFIYFQQGCVLISDKNLKTGLLEYQKEISSLVKDFPPELRRDVMCYMELVSKKFRKLLVSNYITPQNPIEHAIPCVVRELFQILKSSSKEQDSTQKTKVLRTYKVGLRVPESLLTPQNRLIRIREILQFFRKIHMNQLKSEISSNFNGFIRYKHLEGANSDVRKIYKCEYEKYKDFTLREIFQELALNKKEINKLRWRNKTLNSRLFKTSDVPRFSDASQPVPKDISLYDYQSLANRSFKMVCKYLNMLAHHFISKVPADSQLLIEQALSNAQKKEKKITRSSLVSYPEMAIANVLGRYGNLDQIAFSQMADALKAHNDTTTKLEYVRKLLFPENGSDPDFSEIVPALLAYYSVPNYLKRYLAKVWNVDASWVRNMIVGWRRTIDSFLPLKFQIERLSGVFTKLANFCMKYASTEDEIKIIKRLQKHKLLHLLSKVDLRALLPRELHESYMQLVIKVPSYPSALKRLIGSSTFKISPQNVEQSIHSLMNHVQENMSNLDSQSRGYDNCKIFLNKLTFLKSIVCLPLFTLLFENFIPGNQFTHAAGKLLLYNNFAHHSRLKRLFTALRSIAALTLARMIPSAIAQFKKALIPENCVRKPFTSLKRKRKHLPAPLLSPKYVIERKAHPLNPSFINNEHTTELFKKEKCIWLGLPIYSPDQDTQFVELIKGTRKNVRKKGTFWFELRPSRKIIECVQKGAQVQLIRLNVPRGPTNKIVVDVTLAAHDRKAFAHCGNFLHAWDIQFGTLWFPKDQFLGSDFNQIGSHLVAVGTPDLEIDLTAGANMMEFYEKAYKKLEIYRKCELPHLQTNLATKRYSKKEVGRRTAQITLLHRKRMNLMSEMKRNALMVYLYAGYRTKAQYFVWDSAQGISTRGTRGTLATAITYMPNRKHLFDEFVIWAQDLKEQGLLPHYQLTEPVSPFTSRVCAECFQKTGKMRRSLKPNTSYHNVTCSICGWKGDRHSNSARVSALLLQNRLYVHTTDPVSAIDGLG